MNPDTIGIGLGIGMGDAATSAEAPEDTASHILTEGGDVMTAEGGAHIITEGS